MIDRQRGSYHTFVAVGGGATTDEDAMINPKWTVDSLEAAEREMARLRAENDRLRAALQEYLRDFGDNEDSDSQQMAAKARDALAPAPPQDGGT